MYFKIGSPEPIPPFAHVLSPPSSQRPTEVLIVMPESKRRKNGGRKWLYKQAGIIPFSQQVSEGFNMPSAPATGAPVHVSCDTAAVTAPCSRSSPHHFLLGLSNLSTAVDQVFPGSQAWKELRVLCFLQCGGTWGEEYLPAVTSEFASKTVTRI